MSGSKKAFLKIDNKKYEFPILEGTENHIGIDFSTLRAKTGYLSFDNGFANTASTLSKISYIDGENGILRYRGYDIEDLVNNCSFVEVAYLLVHGSLPTEFELKQFSKYLNFHSMIHEDMQHFFNGFPHDSHPMAILASMVTSLSSFYPHLQSSKDSNFDITAARLISKVRTIAAFSYKKSRGEPVVYPRHDLSYCANFLNMMFSSPVNDYEIDPFYVDILNKLLILHADHGQNCSTTAVRLVGSARANLYAAISAGICALWGPLHGGANQAVIEMLKKIKRSKDIDKYIAKAKDKNDPFRLMGFGHAVYKTYDPRAKICKKMCDELFEKKKISDPLLNIAKELEEKALNDSYFQERNLYPNVDFYTGILYRALGIPTNMLTVMFVIGRLPGWISQWKELYNCEQSKIFRPRQIYVGPTKREFVPIEKRKRVLKPNLEI